MVINVELTFTHRDQLLFIYKIKRTETVTEKDGKKEKNQKTVFCYSFLIYKIVTTIFKNLSVSFLLFLWFHKCHTKAYNIQIF